MSVAGTCFREETCKMWEGYAAEGGVAICSRYRLLKSALALMNDRAFIGLVRYGAAHLIGQRYNLFRLITTKRIQYEDKREVHAFACGSLTHMGAAIVTSTRTIEFIHCP